MNSIYNVLDPFRVGLLITKRCNISCSHCWFNSGPELYETMKLYEAKYFIDEASKIQSVEWISFTGGEPFLYYKMLRDLIKYANKKSLFTECVTNCFWANSDKETEEKLKVLVDAGLEVINISTDDFHQRYIPFINVYNCYSVAKKLGLKIVILCTIFKNCTLNIKEISKRLNDDDIHIIGRKKEKSQISALALENEFLPIGRGIDLPKTEWVFNKGRIEGPCKIVLRDIGIDPSGNVLPCCSAAGLIRKFILGNVKEKSLIKIMEEARETPLFRILSKLGPIGVYNLMMHNRKKDFINRCHVCYEVLNDPKINQIFDVVRN